MSKLLYEALNTPHLKEILSNIREVCNALGIDFFGVGALARNIWYVQNEESPRGTKDIDFGVYVANEEVYHQLHTKLIEDYKYTTATSNAFCLISPQGVQVDLLPFGEIENDGKVIIEGTGLTSINLEGFKEVFEYGTTEAIVENDTFKVCSMPAVVLLKLIAFDDRPENRPKDPIDINSILLYYPQIETDLIYYEEYVFLYEDDKKTFQEIGIEVLGFEISKIIVANEALKNRVLNILNKALNLKSKLAELMIQDAEKETIKMKLGLLQSLQSGILQGIKR